MHGRSRWAGAACALLASAALISACGSSSSSSSPSSSSTSSLAAATGSQAQSTGAAKPTLLVYSAQGYDKNTVAAFQKATGVPTKLVDDSTGPLLARIQAEKANPQWGLIWVDGGTALAALDRQGLLEKNLRVPALNSTGRKLTPADKSFIPTGATMACTMVYNSHAVASPPTSWQELLSATFNGKVGMNDPAVSGPTYPCVAGLFNYLGGIAPGEAYLKKLKANGLHVSQTNGDTLHLLQTGQIQVALIQSSAASGAAKTTPGLKVAYLPKVTLLPGVIGIDGKAPAAVQKEAQQFIDYVLSAPGQHQMQTGDPTGDSLFWPVVPGTAPLSGLAPLSSIDAQVIDPYVWGPREPSINNWFTANVAQ
ncbi:MAG TPA: extracellular solute-binding protein [Solirubrobacteraceae bacterium]|nr:extracellular solute-binding protein [Solirubrobacteraceae bacterium]